MAPSSHVHRRSHSLLLLQKLLNLRDAASPLTLVLDSLEQPAGPLIREFASRAKISRTKIVFVSFATLRRPRDADVFIKARGKALGTLRTEIGTHCPAPSAPTVAPAKGLQGQRALIIIDSLNSLATIEPRFLSAFLSSIITPVCSVVGVYHTDVPLALPRTINEYEPEPFTVLYHLATAVFRISNLYQAIEIRRAQNKSQEEPEWGLREGREGVLIGLRAPDYDTDSRGIVVEMEMRRRSGRAVSEKFVLSPPDQSKVPASSTTGLSSISLLSDHPSFAAPVIPGEEGEDEPRDHDEMETTFNLGLTEKQRRDREGIVLPYFDAQTDIGAGEGGRILYEMGREDDFDDEEDEI